jgi:hypothetical protein
LKTFIGTLDIPPEERQRLLSLKPTDYIGLAADLARDI